MTPFLLNKQPCFEGTEVFFYYVHPLGGGHIIFAFSGVRRILSLPNLACRFIGLIACVGLLLVMIAL